MWTYGSILSVAQPLSIETALWIADFLAFVALFGRLGATRLWRVYRAFSVLVLVNILQSGVLFVVPRLSDWYAIAYFTFLPIRAVCAVLVVLELYSLVLKGYEGIGSLGRWVVSGGLVVSLIAAVISIYPDLASSPGEYPVLLYVGAFERAVNSALLIYLFLITIFLVWFPVPLSRNTVLHTVVFAIFFSSTAVLALIRNVLGMELLPILNTIFLALSLLCALAWVLFLTPAGEATTVVLGHRWRRADSDRLVEQLDSINSTLLRAARK